MDVFPYVGRFCGNTTLCLVCHPLPCPDAVVCCGFFPGDVACGNVGRWCDRCGEFLPGSERREQP